MPDTDRQGPDQQEPGQEEPGQPEQARQGPGQQGLTRQRLIIGISGASGIIYGVRILELLRGLDEAVRPEIHLVMTRSAEITLGYETDISPADLRSRADVAYSNQDVGAAIASGSFRTMGMVIAPCSVKSLGEIANGTGGTLLSRAADVVLKERRRLVCMVRETPLHSGHLRNMLTASKLGAIIAPPVPAFYANPQNIDEMVDQTASRVLDLFDIDVGRAVRWREGDPASP